MTDWRASALCAQTDPAMFFVDKGGNAGPAKNICRRCDVRAECLEDALATETAASEYGIWGGLTAKERRALKRQRAEAA